MAYNQIAENILLKHSVIQACRDIAAIQRFLEVNTPAIRTATSITAPRRRVLTQDHYSATADAFLKTSHDTALRTILRYHPRVFEIGACFRMDPPDATHYPEFMLLEFVASDVDFTFFTDLAQQVVTRLFGANTQFERISVRDFVLSDLHIDIANTDGDALKAAILDASPGTYSKFTALPSFHVVNQYISDKVEPRTGFGIVIDYPLCTISKAKRVGQSNMIHRFEAFINGLEVAHSYLYEDDSEDYVRRSKINNHHNSEVDVTAAMVSSNLLPRRSGILGFGVERLCCALSGRQIADFVFAKEFGFVAQEIRT